MLLCTPARPKNGGGGNGEKMKDRGDFFPPILKRFLLLELHT